MARFAASSPPWSKNTLNGQFENMSLSDGFSSTCVIFWAASVTMAPTLRYVSIAYRSCAAVVSFSHSTCASSTIRWSACFVSWFVSILIERKCIIVSMHGSHISWSIFLRPKPISLLFMSRFVSCANMSYTPVV